MLEIFDIRFDDKIMADYQDIDMEAEIQLEKEAINKNGGPVVKLSKKKASKSITSTVDESTIHSVSIRS